ncbi:MAG: hypothetical protein ACREUZ_07695, partial [Burkholderiales bacterium]
ATTTFLNAGPLPVDVTVENFLPYLEAPEPDGLSAIVFDHTGEIFTELFGADSGVLGFAGPEWADPGTCTILEGLAFLNGPEFTDAVVARDIIVHEFGHYQNLAHTVVNGQIAIGDHRGPTPHDTFPGIVLPGKVETMYPFYFGPEAGTSSPHLDDIVGLSTLYPTAAFAAASGTITGVILASNGRTRLTGVNVIARNIADPDDDAVSAISSNFTNNFSQASALAGAYTLRGLTPGGRYAIYVDEILLGGFSTPPLSPLPGAEEFWNGASETNDRDVDDPAVFTPISVTAGDLVRGIDIILNAFKPGDRLPLADDGSLEIALPFRFEMCGESFESVFVNANGNLTFGAPSSDFSESRFEFLDGPPRAAGLWRDLNPAAGGVVTFAQTKRTFTVSYADVPEFPSTGANTFSITLYRRLDRVDMTYGGATAVAGLAGMSCGGKSTSRFEQQQDLSRHRRFFVELWSDAAGYELFSTARPFDLASSTIRYTGTLDYNDRWAGTNNTLARARRVPVPFSSASILRYTEIEKPSDVDFFKIRAKAGQIVVAEVQTGSMDTVLGVFSRSGTPLAIDDDGGAGPLSRLAFISPSNADYIVGVSTFPDATFSGAGSETGRYVLSVQAFDGTLLPLDNDDSVAVDLGFTFRFQGTSYSNVFVNANGNLTFGAGNQDAIESVDALLSGPPRVAPLWNDLFPANGFVIASEERHALTIHFVSVPELFGDRANNFSVHLDKAGRIALSYEAVLAQDGLVGITSGHSASDPGPSQLSRSREFPRHGTTYELFTPTAPFDLPFKTIRFK